MSLEDLKATVAKMPQEEQNHLAAFLVHLRHLRDPEIRREITARNGEHDPAKWVSVGELREKWGS